MRGSVQEVLDSQSTPPACLRRHAGYLPEPTCHDAVMLHFRHVGKCQLFSTWNSAQEGRHSTPGPYPAWDRFGPNLSHAAPRGIGFPLGYVRSVNCVGTTENEKYTCYWLLCSSASLPSPYCPYQHVCADMRSHTFHGLNGLWLACATSTSSATIFIKANHAASLVTKAQ